LTTPAAPRLLGPVSATCLIVGQVVGIGIFLTPAEMAQGLAAPGLVHAMWALAGFMALAGALCYGELASRFPEAGGAYVYLREGWGEGAAFLYGWQCLLVMDPGITAALGAGLADYVAYLWPGVPGGTRAVAVAAILALGAVTAFGTRLAAGALVALTVLKLTVLAAIVVWGFASADAAAAHGLASFSRSPAAPPLVPALAGGFVAAFFSFGGWWEAARMAGEVRDPQRTLPRAFVAGVSIVTLVYVLTSAVFMALVPPAGAGTATAFAARVGERLFGPAGGTVLALAVIVSVVGSLAAVMLGSPRTYVALAHDGLFPQRLARLHPRLGTPVLAIAVQATLASALVLLGTFSDIVAYFVFVTVAFVAASVATLYRLPAPPGGAFLTPARRFTPAVFIGLCLVLLGLLLAGKPVQALLGVLVVAAGVHAHAALRRTGVLGSEAA
jgi:APA family basic amino acid/polyamine antiporter